MLKRMLFMAAVALALAAPAYAGRPDGTQQVRRAIHVFVKRCANGKADATKCKAAAERLASKLQKLDARLGERIKQIQERCGGANAPKACSRADELVKRLQTMQQRIEQIVQKLQSWQPGGSSDGASGGPATGSRDDSGLESLDQLSADLAAVQAQA